MLNERRSHRSSDHERLEPKCTIMSKETEPWRIHGSSPLRRGNLSSMGYDETADPPALKIRVGSTTLSYRLQCIEDIHAMLVDHDDWIPLGNADEQKDAKPGTVEAWARSEDNAVGGWYGLRKGYRGRFGNYVPPVLEHLGLAELEHNARNNSMRAL
jgi:hypothetical protein